MIDTAPRLTARSAGAIADTDLLRVARTDIAPPLVSPSPSLAGRIRAALVRRPRSRT
ncbi:MAG TPA: hypothetical protein VES19_02810 [Candidatus Limnocylindrales bacterium]|nr:hypothetical protein [Candidatus Limnocylindrales bacterium]